MNSLYCGHVLSRRWFELLCTCQSNAPPPPYQDRWGLVDLKLLPYTYRGLRQIT